MSIIDIVRKIKGEAEARKAEEDAMPDEQTRDKYLRSLRRMRRTQLEELEKARLKKQIENFNKERSRSFMFGLNKDNARSKRVVKKKAMGHSFLGKGNL